ncbi:hypothetical protein ACSPAB_17700 [Buttiauxella agrestis]
MADKRFVEAEEWISQVLDSDIDNQEALVIKGAIALENASSNKPRSVRSMSSNLMNGQRKRRCCWGWP